MVTRHGAKKFITAALPEVEKRLQAGYTIKEIHADLTDLANNISYSTTLRNLQKMGVIEKTSTVISSKKSGSITKSNSTNNFLTKKINNSEHYRSPETFKFDHGTNDDELI